MTGLVWPLAQIDTGSLDRVEPDERVLLAEAAVDFLDRWTGGSFGLRQVTVRPCRSAGAGWSPLRVHGRLWALECGGCGPACRCGGQAASVRFPFRVETVDAVTVGGVLLAESDYWLENHRVLVRAGGLAWPASQNYDAPLDSADVWHVLLTYGTPVPAGGQVAAALLADEMAKAVLADASCKLPQRVQTITRQGVTVGMLDPMEDLGRTGVWLVDSWVESVTKAPGGVSVMSPDYPPRRY